MRRLLILLLACVIVSCEPDDATPTAPINDSFDETNATLLREGSWMGSGGYTVSGSAQIFDDNGQLTLVLNNFSSSNGPDLRVYLSSTTNANTFVNLGRLKSTNGRQVYAIPAGTNIAELKFALIWCQQFSALFGKAETL